MKIDAILPTYNRADLLSRALDSALNAEVPEGHEVQVIIVDNNSSDRTRSVAEQYDSRHGTRFRYLFEPKQGRHHALDCGIRHSLANVIAFFDDDERLVPNWFKTVAENFSQPETLAEAEAAIARFDFDIVMLDMSLPDGSGSELLPRLKNRAGDTIPVIVFRPATPTPTWRGRSRSC